MNHKKALKAYLGRISKADMDKIIEAHNNIWRQQANGNMGSQMKADDQMSEAVNKAIDNMSPENLKHIENNSKKEEQ